MQPQEQVQRELWPIAEFSAAHGISTRQTYAMIQRGDVIAVRVGSRTLIEEASRQKWLAGLERKTKPRAVGAALAA